MTGSDIVKKTNTAHPPSVCISTPFYLIDAVYRTQSAFVTRIPEPEHGKQEILTFDGI